MTTHDWQPDPQRPLYAARRRCTRCKALRETSARGTVYRRKGHFNWHEEEPSCVEAT